jgi:hypothetical protein
MKAEIHGRGKEHPSHLQARICKTLADATRNVLGGNLLSGEQLARSLASSGKGQ